MTDQAPRSAADRLLAVLAAFGHAGPALSLTEISRRAGLTLPTTHRLVGLLTAWGALERDREGVYHIGLRLWELASSASPGPPRVAAHPAVELDSFVWVWIGDPALADEKLIPRAPHLADPNLVTVCGMEPIDGDYGLLVDNLMDLSHETYLHGGYIGTPEVAETPITTEVDEGAGIVRVSRHMADAECPPFYARSTGIQGRITRLQDIEYFAPCLYLLHSRIMPVGQDAPVFRTEITYAITPSAPGKVYDFWAVSRDFATDDDEVTAFLRDFNHQVVMQDVDALNLLHRALDSEPAGYQELSINIDTGGLAARRILARLAAA